MFTSQERELGRSPVSRPPEETGKKGRARGRIGGGFLEKDLRGENGRVKIGGNRFGDAHKESRPPWEELNPKRMRKTPLKRKRKSENRGPNKKGGLISGAVYGQ